MNETENLSFKEELAQDATVEPAVNQPTGKKRGRPKKVIEPPKPPEQKPIPICNEAEAAIIANALVAVVNAFIKKEHREKLFVTHDEMLAVARPLVVLKDYYLPNMGGIYAVWGQLALTAGAIGFAKYNIMKEIMETPDGRKESKTDSGDAGNGEVNESQGTTPNVPENSGV